MSFLGGLGKSIRKAVRIARGENTPTISQNDLIRQLEMHAAPLILDVRTPEEFEEGHLPGSVNIPHTELRDRLSEIRPSQDKPIVVH